MRAQRIDGLEADMPLATAARLIVAVRAAELYAFVPEALDERSVAALHDMRIAAKRLRYLLELVGFCFGEVGGEAQGRARELQEVLGEIHDCDVMLERIAAIRDRDREGFDALVARFRAERDEQFARFCERWSAIERSRLRERLLAHTIVTPLDEPLGA
jgi:CHAD domain-containing protein